MRFRPFGCSGRPRSNVTRRTGRVVCRRSPRLNRDGGLGCSPHFLWGVGRAYLAPSFLRRGRLVRELADVDSGRRPVALEDVNRIRGDAVEGTDEERRCGLARIGDGCGHRAASVVHV